MKLRFEVFKRDNFTCRYCGRKSPEAILEVDHLIPRAEGGETESDNLVTSCYECNRGKGATLITQTMGQQPDLHEKTILIAEHELQLAEYRHWRTVQKQREDSELELLNKQWRVRWGQGGQHCWKISEVRTFLRKLGMVELVDILEVVAEQTHGGHGGNPRPADAWKYFCCICWHRIKQTLQIDG